MKSEKTAIQILSLSALVLLLALIFLPGKPATADTIGNQDLMAVTAQAQNGDALYVCDLRDQAVMVLVWNPNTRTVEPQAIRKLK
jgi:hypothetical protein